MKHDVDILNWTPPPRRKDWNWQFLKRWSNEDLNELAVRRAINRQRLAPPVPEKPDPWKRNK